MKQKLNFLKSYRFSKIKKIIFKNLYSVALIKMI